MLNHIDAEPDPSGFKLIYDGTNTFYFQIWGTESLTDTWDALDVESGYNQQQTWVDPISLTTQKAFFYRVNKVDIQTPNDIDGDGIHDLLEHSHFFLNPLDPTDATNDLDGNGLDNLQESLIGLDITLVDSDADGMEDGYEVQHACLNPQLSDADGNPDGDAIANLMEMLLGSDPCIANTGTGSLSVVYVDGLNGNNTNDGSITFPVATIQKGIDLVSSNSVGQVIVAAGNYTENNILYNGVYVQGAGTDLTISTGRFDIVGVTNAGVRAMTIADSGGYGVNIDQSDGILLQPESVR
ncbi:MAG: hypothetical protein GKR87_11405 [Kiritimatiellae bacterium]|nr:hypothetical protein [Kiritimatiellia bacterium]NKB24961.1 hypothetical protein [Kiritimatiellia bacterium]